MELGSVITGRDEALYLYFCTYNISYKQLLGSRAMTLLTFLFPVVVFCLFFFFFETILFPHPGLKC